VGHGIRKDQRSDPIPQVEAEDKPVGGRPKRKSKEFFGKKACTRKTTAGRKNNTRACEGIPNDGRVRVWVRYCKRLKSQKCINIDT
jgi:hypothetical protein